MPITLVAVALALAPAQFQPSVQDWTFNKFTTEQAIQKAAQAGSTNLELFPGQTLSTSDESVKVGPEMGDANTAKLKGFLDAAGLKVVAFGVTGIPKDSEGARKLVRWAKGLGIQVINTESVDALDTIEMMVKEFDMKVGFHDHPKRENEPNYRMWDPNYIYGLVKDRDKRIGSCADTGHWVRSGIKPIDAIRILKGRIVSSHLKDLNEFSPNGHDVPYGMGVSDAEAILEEYRKIGMSGPVSVEYEYNWDTNLTEVAQCIGFMRAYKLRK
ncbi:MAG TPA: sugar phosphate isomerase/epimerase [Terriglobia bacterium]|nr:sugar phosphate isomerase/epimerase [Terriglobia bacterium]